MKTLIINGSPKNTGSTSAILNKIKEGLYSDDNIIKAINLSEKIINYCTGCEICKKTKRCFQKDDMKKIITDIIDSDLIIIGSPSYWGYVTGQLKVFFDRCTPLCNTNPGGSPVPKGKYGFSLAVRAGKSKEENIEIIKAIEHFFGHLNIVPIGFLTIENIKSVDDIYSNKHLNEKAINIGRKLFIKCHPDI